MALAVRVLVFALVWITSTGCSHLLYDGSYQVQVPEKNEPESPTPEQLAEQKGLEYRAEVSSQLDHSLQYLVRPKTMHKTVGDYANQLAMLLMDRAFSLKQSDRIAVASFVRFNQTLREPTVLGNRLAEAMGVELQQYGMSIVETKLATDLAISDRGDLALSRNPHHLPDHLNVDFILTGTLVERGEGVTVNARIVSVDNHAVAAAASLYIPQFIVANEHYFIPALR